jgi:hypothetical protein
MSRLAVALLKHAGCDINTRRVFSFLLVYRVKEFIPSLIDYASAAECVLGTGRVLGDVGQATFVGSPGQLLVGLIM